MRLSISARVVLASCSLVSLLWAASARAQEFTSEALRDGSWSIDFSIDDNFQISSFEGSAISATQHTSASKAWRYGLSFFGSGVDQDLERFAPFDTTATDEDISTISIGVSVLRLVYPEVTGRVRPYLGLGPTIDYFHAENSRTTVDPADQRTTSLEVSNSSWTAGAQFVLGVEVFAAKRISLLGQYGASLTYRHTSSETVNVFVDPITEPIRESNETTSDGWRLGPNSVRFGVSAYF